jgi:hypothetical protein
MFDNMGYHDLEPRTSHDDASVKRSGAATGAPNSAAPAASSAISAPAAAATSAGPRAVAGENEWPSSRSLDDERQSSTEFEAEERRRRRRHQRDRDDSGILSGAPATAALLSSSSGGLRTKHKQIHLSDIVAWTQLSHQYSLAYALVEGGGALEPVGVYDKSFRKPDFELSKGNFKETLAMGFHTNEGIHAISIARRTRQVKSLIELLCIVFEQRAHPHPAAASASPPAASSQSSAAAAAADPSGSGHEHASSNTGPTANGHGRDSDANTQSHSSNGTSRPRSRSRSRSGSESCDKRKKKNRARAEAVIVPDDFFDDPAHSAFFIRRPNESPNVVAAASQQSSSYHHQRQQHHSMFGLSSTPAPSASSALSEPLLGSNTNHNPSPSPSLSPYPSPSLAHPSSFSLLARPSRNATATPATITASSFSLQESGFAAGEQQLLSVPASSSVSGMYTSSSSSPAISLSPSASVSGGATPSRRSTIRFTELDWGSLLTRQPAVRALLRKRFSEAELEQLVHGSRAPPSLPPDQMSSADKERYSPLLLYLHSLVFKRMKKPASALGIGGEKGVGERDTYVYHLSLNRSRPVKIIDLRYPESSFLVATARASLTNILKGGIGSIPFYGPPQVVVAALERVFDYGDVLMLQKQAEAMELVLETLRGNPRSPFTHPHLTNKHLMDSMFYLLRSNIMLGVRNKRRILDRTTACTQPVQGGTHCGFLCSACVCHV